MESRQESRHVESRHTPHTTTQLQCPGRLLVSVLIPPRLSLRRAVPRATATIHATRTADRRQGWRRTARDRRSRSRAPPSHRRASGLGLRSPSPLPPLPRLARPTRIPTPTTSTVLVPEQATSHPPSHSTTSYGVLNPVPHKGPILHAEHANTATSPLCHRQPRAVTSEPQAVRTP